MNNTLHDLLVISDLDNTLLTARNEIPQANRDMIRLFCARGGRFTVASGRSVTSVQAALAGVPLSAPVICCGGSVIYDMVKQQCLERRTLDADRARAAAAALMARYPELGVCVHTGLGDWKIVRANVHLEAKRRSERIGYTLSQLDDVPAGWVKVVFAGSAPQLDQAEQFLQDRDLRSRMELIRTGTGTLELLPAGVSKAFGLQALSGLCQVPPERMIMIGDHYSDLDAMCLAGRAVAVAGAPASVRLAADTVTSITCGEGAVAEFLYRLVKEYEAQT